MPRTLVCTAATMAVVQASKERLTMPRSCHPHRCHCHQLCMSEQRMAHNAKAPSPMPLPLPSLPLSEEQGWKTLPRHPRPGRRHCCRCLSKQLMGNDSKAPSSALPPLPPPPLLHEQVKDGQRCRGTFVCAAATAIVVERAIKDGGQC
jgi:hypothetical protein